MRKINLVLIFLLVLVFWKFLLPGVRVANDYPIISSEMAQSSFKLPSLWAERGAEGLGENVISTLWSWPADFLYGVGGKIGLSFSVVERLLGIIPFLLLGGWGINRFLRRNGIEGLANIATSLFYLANSYVILLIDGGQLSIALAYAWFPTAYLAFEDSLNASLKKRVVTALSIWVLGVFDIRFVYILGLLLILRFGYEFLFLKKDKLKWTSEWIKSGGLSLFALLGLNAFWIVPALFLKGVSLPVAFQRS